MNMTTDLDKYVEEKEDQTRKVVSESTEMRKTDKCAKSLEITFYCDLVGYDIKTLNAATGKGSYMLKAGEQTVIVPYSGQGGIKEKKVVLTLYKVKGLRGLLRRAAEVHLLALKEAGKVTMGPCTPNANYPHQEIIDDHVELGYHLQGTCTPMCLVRRLYGSLDYAATIRVFPPYIAKPSAENIPLPVHEYLASNICSIFGLEDGIIYHNGESTLKVETCNIINRKTEIAVNNFMKHSANGVFPFRVTFRLGSETPKELLQRIGFFLASLTEINDENGLQLGADKNNGSGQVKINVRNFKSNIKFPDIEKFVKTEKIRERVTKFGNLELKNSITEYYLDPLFGPYVIDLFNTHLEMD